MSAKTHFARSSLRFNEFLDRERGWLNSRVPSHLPYSTDAVTRRLLQRTAQLSFEPFLKQPDTRNVGGLIVRLDNGAVNPTLRLVVRESLRFLVQWLRYAGHALGACAWKKGFSESWILVYGLTPGEIFDDESDQAFVRFCQEGPVPALRKTDRLLIQMTGVSLPKMLLLTYDRNPLTAVARASSISPKEFLVFLSQHFAVLGIYLRFLFSFRVGCLLAEDLAMHALAMLLNDQLALEAVVMSSSHFPRQWLWMNDLPRRHMESHMVWYSVNSSPLIYKEDPVEAFLPGFRHMKIDHWWLWTDGHADHIRRMGLSGNTHVVGPVLWRMPGQVPLVRRSGRLQVGLFSVTPVTVEREQALGLRYNYYSSENMIRFLDDVVAISSAMARLLSCEVDVVVKLKRQPVKILKSGQSHHDGGYIDHVERLHQSGSITVVPPETNLFDLARNCDLVVVIPFSSPAYVAMHLGVPAIFYDPVNVLVPAFEPSALIELVQTPEALLAAMQKHLSAALRQYNESRVEEISLTQRRIG